MERKDYYEKPKDGYMAVHYIIESNMTLDDADLLRAREQGAMP